MTKAHAGEPEPGMHQIEEVAILGGFMDGTVFELARGLNCIIGARGTGKSTTLELVRYCLDLGSTESGAADALQGLVKATLGGGRVRVRIRTRNGQRFTVSRVAQEAPTVWAEDEKPTELGVESRALFRPCLFSQNEMESIAMDRLAQLDLIDRFEPERIADINGKLRALRAKLEANASEVMAQNETVCTLDEALTELPGVTKRLEALGVAGGKEAGEINAAHAQKVLRDRERRSMETASQSLDAAASSLTKCLGTIRNGVKGLLEPELLKGSNAKQLLEMGEGLMTLATKVDKQLEALLWSIETEQQTLSERRQRMDGLHKDQDLNFRKLVEKHEQARGQAQERAKTELWRNELLAQQRERCETQARIEVLREERIGLLGQLSELREARFRIRKQVADRISEELAPDIRVQLEHLGNRDPYRQYLEEKLVGARVNRMQVAAKLAVLVPVELAAALRARDIKTLVDQAGVSKDQAEKVLPLLAEPGVLFDLEAAELLDRPVIELKDGQTYKRSEALSKGQKCTAILPIVLMDSDRPLWIDQPEDNLDNRFVSHAVVEKLRAGKLRRQMIFITHNPNIAVLSEPDKVWVMDSNGERAGKTKEGTVDECRDEIVSLLEGGDEAFEERRKRYGTRRGRTR